MLILRALRKHAEQSKGHTKGVEELWVLLEQRAEKAKANKKEFLWRARDAEQRSQDLEK